MEKERIIDFKTMKDPSNCKYAQFQLGFYKSLLGSSALRGKPIYIDTDFPKDVLSHVIGAKLTTAKLIKPVRRVMFNGIATILEIGDFKTVVKCDEKDTFEEYIGLGLALSRYYAKQPSTKKEFATLKYCFNPQYKDLAVYCIHKYFDYDSKRILKFFDGIGKGKWVEL